MSRMWTIGRQGVPSLLMLTSPVVCAHATRLLRTTSQRRRGETPYAVAFRSDTTVYAVRRARDVAPTRTFDSP